MFKKNLHKIDFLTVNEQSKICMYKNMQYDMNLMIMQNMMMMCINIKK
jgi:hypothetical protein